MSCPLLLKMYAFRIIKTVGETSISHPAHPHHRQKFIHISKNRQVEL